MPSVQAETVRHIALDRVGSTNDEALARARAGDRGPFWVTARAQAAGRGRRGRSWVSEPGNLYATLLLTDPCPPAQAPQLSFVAALAVHDAVLALAPGCRPLLKWPNDVLLGGRKLAGILVEGEGGPTSFLVAVGVGINCSSHPADAAFPATDLVAEGLSAGADLVFAALARAAQLRLAQWDRGRGFERIRADWLARAAALGEEVRVRLPDRVASGTFQGLDEAGRLLLERAGGAREVIAAGEVFALGAGVPAREGTT
jgi:BirA family transcriptional regulator, biotin operon repressor / biotin---[acetyl-CoA-carboxylase] ligase